MLKCDADALVMLVSMVSAKNELSNLPIRKLPPTVVSVARMLGETLRMAYGELPKCEGCGGKKVPIPGFQLCPGCDAEEVGRRLTEVHEAVRMREFHLRASQKMYAVLREDAERFDAERKNG